MNKRAVILTTCAIFAAGGAFAAEKSFYVKSLVAKLYQNPDFGSKVLGSVPRGEPVTLMETKQQWSLVKKAEMSGWVSTMILSETPPLQSGSVFSGEEHDLSKGARRRASSVATSGASRGLVSEERQRLEEVGTNADYITLKKIEERTVDPEKALAFVAELEK